VIRTVVLWAIYCPASKRILYHSPTKKRLHKNVPECVCLKLKATYSTECVAKLKQGEPT
jgi:hypothetical protein